MGVLFKGRYLLNNYLSRPVSGQAVLVEDGTIVKIGSEKELSKEADDVYDLGNVIIAPSFANTHAHIGMVALRGIGESRRLQDWLGEVWQIEAELDQETLYDSSILGLGELVNSGVTAVLDFYDIDSMLRALDSIALPIRAKLGLVFMDNVEYLREESWHRLGEIGSIASRIREMGYDLFLSPHSLYGASQELLQELFGLEGFKYQMHFAENLEELKEIKRRYGEEPAKVLESLGALDKWIVLAHTVHIGKAEMKALARSNIFVSHCNARLASGIAKLNEMKHEGVQVTIGTDGAGSSETLNIFNEIRLATTLARSVSAKTEPSIREVMHMASYTGHSALGIRAGELKEGNLADFIAYDLNKIYPSFDIVSALGYQGGPETIKDVVAGGIFLKANYRLSFQTLYEESKKEIEDFINTKNSKKVASVEPANKITV